MFAVEHVVQIFPLLEDAEKERPFFTPEEKQMLYRIAFHKESFTEVQKLVAQVSAPHLNGENRKQLLEYHAGRLQTPQNSAAIQIENFIFQTQLMIYEKEKANRILENILERNGLKKEIGFMRTELPEKPMQPQNAKYAEQYKKSI